jgi:hypothetical protein
MPKPKIKKQTISVDVQFDPGDRLDDKSSGDTLVVVQLGATKLVLINRQYWVVEGPVHTVPWHNNEYILGSDLAKALYGGTGTLQDLLNDYKFTGSIETQKAVNELPSDT